MIRDELPDLLSAPAEDERVSIYLRIILGPRFHERLLLGAKGAKEQKERITEFQKRIGKTIRRRGDALEDLVRTCGEEDLFVSFRIAITPYARRNELGEKRFVEIAIVLREGDPPGKTRGGSIPHRSPGRRPRNIDASSTRGRRRLRGTDEIAPKPEVL
jgi:hypothetical protein